MRFADCFGAKVIVLHVISLPYPYITVWRLSVALLTDDVRKGAARRMQRFLETDRVPWPKSSNSYYQGTPDNGDLLIRGKERCRPHHYIDARAERLKTRIDRQHGGEGSATRVLPCLGGSISSENQTGQALETGQTQDECDDKPAATTEKIRRATIRERSHGTI